MYSFTWQKSIVIPISFTRRLNEKKKLKKMKKDNRIQETEYGDFKQLQGEVVFY